MRSSAASIAISIRWACPDSDRARSRATWAAPASAGSRSDRASGHWVMSASAARPSTCRSRPARSAPVPPGAAPARPRESLPAGGHGLLSSIIRRRATVSRDTRSRSAVRRAVHRRSHHEAATTPITTASPNASTASHSPVGSSSARLAQDRAVNVTDTSPRSPGCETGQTLSPSSGAVTASDPTTGRSSVKSCTVPMSPGLRRSRSGSFWIWLSDAMRVQPQDLPARALFAVDLGHLWLACVWGP